jgi:type IV pilus assembly protein PilB
MTELQGGVGRKAGCYVVQSREQKRRSGILEDFIVGTVDELLYQAIRARASDIHVHLQQQELVVRLRIDGVLQLFAAPIVDQAAQIFARLKILANLDVSDARLPQDGKCTVMLTIGQQEKSVDLRFATMPAVSGEKLLIRILDAQQHFLGLEMLGLSATHERALSKLMQLPYGLVLTTGPTGSGKTTTLYALLATINSNDRQILTLEDPVEYSLAGIVQTQVNPKIGFTFEQGLRAMLRQDPDVMMIGEIRDRLTAQTALEAALTGHLVLSTLHTKDAVGSLVRLREMGIESYLLTAALTAVVGQRIVRRLCEQCKQSGSPTANEKVILEQVGVSMSTVQRAGRCGACFGTGYYGRVGLYEVCFISDELRDGIIKNASLAALRSVAQQQGFVSFVQDALAKIEAGIISIDELVRIID